jgi:hypothetical protein
MSRKLYALLLPVLAVAAMAMTAGAAQANTAGGHWFICKKAGAGSKYADSECQKKQVANGNGWPSLTGRPNLVQVVTFGKLTITITGVVTITCKVIDAGNIWNLEAGGKDEVTAFTNYECKATPAEDCLEPEIVAKGLPWATELTETRQKNTSSRSQA